MEFLNQIVHGDCVEALKVLPAACVDLVVTDPPYGIDYRDRSGRTVANDNTPAAVVGCFGELWRVMRPNSLCVCFYGWSKVGPFYDAWLEAGFTPVGHIVWEKQYASSARFLESRHEMAYLLAKGRPNRPAKPLPDVLPWEYTGNKVHPTEKAVSVLEPLVESFSQPGDLVLDPFAGSGSTCVAAAFSGRDYCGIELEARYCELARKRLAGAARYRPWRAAA